MQRNTITVMLLAAVISNAVACNENKNQELEREGLKNKDTFQQIPHTAVDALLFTDSLRFKDTISPAFKGKFSQLVNAYLGMKDGFVAANQQQIAQQAAKMMGIINNMPVILLQGKALANWKEKEGFLRQQLLLYKQETQEKDKQLNFVILSNIMVRAVRAFGYEKHPLYIDYCPKANSNRGAYWLSRTKEIKNPYLDGNMPDCGEIIMEL